LRRANIPPGQHGAKGKRKVSGYGQQLREKQKVKRMYGVLERQFRKTFERAKKWRGNTGEKLLEFMERRLDNVLYRASLAPTRASARQFVNHGHVTVDGEKVTIPSFLVDRDQVITMKSKSLAIPAVSKLLEDKTIKVPEWVERKGPVIKIVRLPVRTDVSEDISEQLIVEHYSR
jgi:small subunit ribosomal protein S4